MAGFDFRKLFPQNPVRSWGDPDDKLGGEAGTEQEPAQGVVLGRRHYQEEGTGLHSLYFSGDVMLPGTLSPGTSVNPPDHTLPDQNVDPNVAAGDPAIPPGLPMLPKGDPRYHAYTARPLPKSSRMDAPPWKQHQAFALSSSTGKAVLVDTDVGFMIRSMQIENYSSVWVLVDAVMKWIPPLFSAEFIVSRRSQRLFIVEQPPAGTTQPAATSGQQVVVTVSEGPDLVSFFASL